MIHPRASLLVAVVVFAFAGLLAGCAPAAPTKSGDAVSTAPGWFEDVTDKVGLDFVHDPGPIDGAYFMPQILGSGAALFDLDGDGRLDMYLLQNGGPKSSSTNRLYRQLPDGRFQDVSKGSGLDIAGWNMGVAVGDVDGDGRPDVLVTQYGGVKLFHNNGDGTFTDVTHDSGLQNPSWGTSAAFFDYDRDGRLDLVVVNYLDYDPSWPCITQSGARDYCSPNGLPGTVTRLFHNVSVRGGPPRFEDVTVASGLGRLPGPGLGVLCADFDGDGWLDIFVSNDGQPNRLWVNQHDGTFHEEAVRRGVAYNGMGEAQAGMGAALGDVDGDGMEDLFVTHLGWETNALWVQGPRGMFHDRTGAAGLASPQWRGTGFGTALADFNQDGRLDLAVVNGRITRGPVAGALGPHWSAYAERNQLFVGDESGRFRDVSADQGTLCGMANVARGLIAADVDGDGALDLLVTTAGDRARLLRNTAPGRGHWLMVRAFDPTLGRDAYGALVTVRAGDRRWVRRADPCAGYLCSGDPRAHFGLGPAARVDELEVRWPDGVREVFPAAQGSADRVVEVRKGEGRPGPEQRNSDR